MGLSVREVVAVLDLLGVDRSHVAVWNWTHDLAEAQADPPTAKPSRVAVDEKQIEVDGEKKWLYAAIDTESKLLLDIDVYSRRGTDPAAAFLHRLTEKHTVSDAEFLIDGGGYLTVLVQHNLNGQLDYRERNHIERSWVEDCWSVLTSRWKSQQARVAHSCHPTNDVSNQDVCLGASGREPAGTGPLA